MTQRIMSAFVQLLFFEQINAKSIVIMSYAGKVKKFWGVTFSCCSKRILEAFVKIPPPIMILRVSIAWLLALSKVRKGCRDMDFTPIG